MSFEEKVCEIGSLTASADLRTHQGKYVKVSGVTTVTVTAASTDEPIGVLRNKPNTGEAAAIAVSGIVQMVSGAAITAGAQLMSDASGRCITAATTGNKTYGRALESSSGAGVVIAVLIPAVQRIVP